MAGGCGSQRLEVADSARIPDGVGRATPGSAAAMLSFLSNTRVYLAAGATDLRKSFDILAGVVRNSLRLDPLSGLKEYLPDGNSRRGQATTPGVVPMGPDRIQILRCAVQRKREVCHVVRDTPLGILAHLEAANHQHLCGGGSTVCLAPPGTTRQGLSIHIVSQNDAILRRRKIQPPPQSNQPLKTTKNQTRSF